MSRHVHSDHEMLGLLGDLTLALLLLVFMMFGLGLVAPAVLL
ncbi:hypothetical protein [Nocardia sp. NPDC046763]